MDIMSDLHVDIYTRSKDIGPKQFVNRFFPKNGQLLIIAGDITHKNNELVELFTLLNKIYDKVVVIPGNHDFYLIEEYLQEDEKFSNDRYANLIKACSETNTVLLNCEYFDYEGFRIFGMQGWYDGSYGIKHFNYNNYRLNNLWRNIMNDSQKISFRDNPYPVFDDMNAHERLKLGNMGLVEADIFVSHTCPYNEKTDIDERYREEISTAFFCFDGSSILEQIKPELVIHGHTHRTKDVVRGDTRVVCHPLGYPWEETGATKPKRVILNKENK